MDMAVVEERMASKRMCVRGNGMCCLIVLLLFVMGGAANFELSVPCARLEKLFVLCFCLTVMVIECDGVACS